MKLIYIANARIPTEKAHGIQIMQMCVAFAKNNEVELVIPRRVNWIKENPFEYYGIERNFSITKLPCLDLIPFDKYIGHFGMLTESLTFNLFVFPYILFKKADIIYTRDKFLLPLCLFLGNIIFEAHTFPKNYFLYSPFLKKVKGVVVITQGLKDLFVKWGISADKVLVVPDGVDLRKFQITNSKSQIRERLGLPQNKKIVLYTGHLYSWKGAQILAEASRYLPEDVEVYFVGGTKEDIEKFKVRCSNRSNVRIVGHRPHSEIPYWLKGADVLVLPNSGKEEISKNWTSPLKMFEYMASKTPIVASDLPSIREILNEENAVLAEADNPEKFAEGIKKVMEKQELSDKISHRAFQDVQKYSWQDRAKRIYEYFSIAEK